MRPDILCPWKTFVLGLAVLAGAGAIPIGARGEMSPQRGIGPGRGAGAQGRGRVTAPPRGRGPGGSASAGRIQRRTYVLTETNETMEYDVFVSTKVDQTKPGPLVIALHGLGNPPDRWLPRITDAAQKAGYIVAAPMGYTVSGWYGANGPGRPVGSSSVGELSQKDVMNVLALMKEEFNIDERRIYLAGHSMGGAGALFLGIEHKEIWAAVAASSAAIRSALHTPAELEAAIELPIVFMHGSADRAVPVAQTREWVAKAKALKMTYEYHEIRGAGHADALDKGAHFLFEFFDKHVKPAER